MVSTRAKKTGLYFDQAGPSGPMSKRTKKAGLARTSSAPLMQRPARSRHELSLFGSPPASGAGMRGVPGAPPPKTRKKRPKKKKKPHADPAVRELLTMSRKQLVATGHEVNETGCIGKRGDPLSKMSKERLIKEIKKKVPIERADAGGRMSGPGWKLSGGWTYGGGR